MTPLQKIAMGLVIVFLTARFPQFGAYDVLADPVGWVLVLLGVWVLPIEGLRTPAIVAAVTSVALWFPQLRERLDDSALWAAGLPQAVFLILLCHRLANLAVDENERGLALAFGLLRWAWIAVALLPVLVLGGGLTWLADPADVLTLVTSAATVWFCFSAHRRTWLGGPGPKEWVKPGR